MSSCILDKACLPKDSSDICFFQYRYLNSVSLDGGFGIMMWRKYMLEAKSLMQIMVQYVDISG